MKTNIKFHIILVLAVFLFSCKKDKVVNNSPPDTYHMGLDVSDSDLVKLWPVADTAEFYKLRLLGFDAAFSLPMPEAKNQDKKESCTSFAFAYCQAFYLKELLHLPDYNFNDKTIFSPEFLHNFTSPGGTCDKTGRTVDEVANAVKVIGVCTWNKMPFSGSNPCTGNMPDAAQFENADFFRIKERYMVRFMIPAYIKYLLDNKRTPIIIGVKIDKGFQDDGKNNNVFIWNHASGEKLGNHAMVITGWDDNKGGPGVGAYKVLNSWGKVWGDNGYAWIDYDYLSSVLVLDAPLYKSAYIIRPDIDSIRIRPSLTTDTSSVDSTSATFSATIHSQGADAITEEGFYYGKTLSSLTKVNVTTLSDVYFTKTITGLEPDTKYELISYAKNVYGTKYDTLHGGFRTKPSNNSDCPATVTDIDGNVYNVVQIGTQCWMKENLKTTRYNDGTAIPGGLNNTQWQTTTNGAYAIYNDNLANNAIYGKLYNGYAVQTGKLAPAGWHIPTEAEWIMLVNFLGGESVAGGAMKATTLWNSPNTGATNSSGFTGLPGVNRNSNPANYPNPGDYGHFWSSTQYLQSLYFLDLAFDNSKAIGNIGGLSYGFSVRCIRD